MRGRKVKKIKVRKIHKIRPTSKPKLSLLPKYLNPRKVSSHNFINRVYSKSLCLKINFSELLFSYVNLRGARFNACKFNSTKFTCVDFNGTIFKRAKFRNTEFKKCLFYGTIFKDCDFNNCIFRDCVFINTDVSNAGVQTGRNIVLHNQPDVYFSHKMLEVIDFYKGNKILTTSRILHIKGGKINKATFYVINKRVTDENKIIFGLDKAFSGKGKNKIPHTSHSLMEVIERAS